MISKQTTFKLVLSLALLASGIALVLKSPSFQATTAQAQTGSNISTTWTATGFVNITAHGENSTPLGPVTIGVTKWHNVTQQDGQTIYTEDWTADLPAGDVFFGRSGNNNGNGLDLEGGLNRSSWIYGVGGLNINDNAPYRFTFTNTPAAERSSNYIGRQWFASLGNNVHCNNNGNASCVGATGAYGFGTYHNMGDGINNFPTGFGAMIPTKWTVTGTLL
jgi:hypothetical protein